MTATVDQRLDRPKPTVIVVLGVSGSGKSEIGALLAQALNWQFEDADDYHSPGNIEKMREGHSLNDEDRKPWLASLAFAINDWIETGSGTVLACSALKNDYRRVLKQDSDQVAFVYLKGSYETIHARLTQRHGHFMKADMLKSQFATLEEPADAVVVDIDWTREEIVDCIEKALGFLPSGDGQTVA